jgi:hypothetical protein
MVAHRLFRGGNIVLCDSTINRRVRFPSPPADIFRKVMRYALKMDVNQRR